MTSQDGNNGGSRELLNDPSKVRAWLAKYHPKQLSNLDKFEIELRLGRLSGGADTSGAESILSSASSSSSKTPSTSVRVLMTAKTIELLKMIIGGTRWKTPAQLMTLLRGIGKELQNAGGFREPAIGNVVRRVIAAVREEVMNNTTSGNDEHQQGSGSSSGGGAGSDQQPLPQRQFKSSLEGMLWALPQHVRSTSHGAGHLTHSQTNLEDVVIYDTSAAEVDLPQIFYQDNRPDLKQSLMEAIQEITSELEDLHKNISEQSTNQIHSGEIILTYGRSETVELFLKAAAEKKLRFTVIICEGAPHYEGHDMAKALSVDTSGAIETCVIHDSALFTMMARVNKVILPAHAVLANGGLICPSGCNTVVLAAKQNAVPVICLTGMFKLTPIFPHHGQDTLNDLLSPSPVFDRHCTPQGIDNGAENDGGGVINNDENFFGTKLHNAAYDDVDFVNPVHDYIRPELINLYVTNVGSFQPSYIYRLLAEYYHSDDWESF